jgi:hypothetical protein
MTIAGKPLFYYKEFRSDPDGQDNNFRETKSCSSGFPRLQARFHCTESCPEWEHYTLCLVENRKLPCNYLLQFVENTRKSLSKAKHCVHHLAMAVH